MAPKTNLGHAVCVLLTSFSTTIACAQSTPDTKPAPQFPTTLQDAAAATLAATTWSVEEIAAAKARCTIVLRGLDVVAVPKEPLRDGECGTPAPMELVSIGRNPQVTFSPPPTVTCDLIQALSGWLKSEVQPAARTMLDGPVVRVAVMSDYSCRNAYGRKGSRLSEHGRANAIDIASFVTNRGTGATVLTDWGMTERDVAARIAAAEKAQRSLDARKAVAAKTARPAPSAPSLIAANDSPKRPAATIADLAARGALPDSFSEASSGLARAIGSELRGTHSDPVALGLTSPGRLGGPKDAGDGQSSVPALNEGGARQHFLRHLHETACRTFGTTLGPEANAFHRNHFHLDMAMRQSLRICE
jgi:hypothetical protein